MPTNETRHLDSTTTIISSIVTYGLPDNLVTYKASAEESLDYARKIIVKTDEELQEAIDLATRIKSTAKAVDEHRKMLKDPFDQWAKKIQAAFKPILDTFDQAEARVKTAILEHHREVERRRLELERQEQERYQRQLEEAKKEKAATDALFGPSETASNPVLDVAPPVMTIPQAGPLRGTAGSASIGKVWKWRLKDITKVDRENLMLNESLITAKVKAGERIISGIEIYQEDSMSIRR